jgi:flagellin-like protein
MKSKSVKLFDMDDTRAVSPVIATILVVAITVILAAVIGSSILGLTNVLKEPVPVVSLSVADAPENAPPPGPTNGKITNWAEISHNNGDIIDASDLKILIKDSSGASVATLQQSNSYSYYEGDNDANDYLRLYSDSSRSSTVETTGTLTADETWYIAVDNARYKASVLAFPDGQYTITLIHQPSQSLILQSEVTIS